MVHPDDAVSVSRAPPGVIAPKPAEVSSFVTHNLDDEPVSLVEKWYGAKWIACDVDDLVSAEP